MTSLGERLRALTGASVRPHPAVPADGSVESEPGSAIRRGAQVAADAARVLGGDVRQRDGRTFVVVDREVPLDEMHGRIRLGDSAMVAARLSEEFSVLAGAAPDPDAGERLLYFDLETTGLQGGAGTHAFLVGCGWFADAGMHLRQYVMTGFGDEPAMLEAVAEDLREIGALVTYNGRTFDVPLLDMRYRFHRRPSPFDAMAHLDMLHTARRLWRGEDDEAAGTTARCSLGVLEATICGVRRDGDVAGCEIPSRYFQFVRTGDARPLGAVLAHNRFDLLSLAVLTARALRLVRTGATLADSVRECAGLGRVFERAGRLEAALDCYGQAGGVQARIESGEGGAVRADALRRYASLCRRHRRFAEAAVAWQSVLAMRRCPPHVRREASEALAIHYEHRAKDLEAARRFTLDAMLPGLDRRRGDAVRHRLARLDRKMACAPSDPECSPLIAEEP